MIIHGKNTCKAFLLTLLSGIPVYGLATLFSFSATTTFIIALPVGSYAMLFSISRWPVFYF